MSLLALAKTYGSVQFSQMYSTLFITPSSTMRFLLASFPSAQLQSPQKALPRASSSILSLSGPTLCTALTSVLMAPFCAIRGLLAGQTAMLASVLQHWLTIGAFGLSLISFTQFWIPPAAAIGALVSMCMLRCARAMLAGPTTQSFETVSMLDRKAGAPESNCFCTGHTSLATAMFRANLMNAKSTSSVFVFASALGVNSFIHFASASFSFLSLSLSPSAWSTLAWHVSCFHINNASMFFSTLLQFSLSSSNASSNVSRSSLTCRLTAMSNSLNAMSKKSFIGFSSILFSFLPTSSAIVSFFVIGPVFFVRETLLPPSPPVLVSSTTITGLSTLFTNPGQQQGKGRAGSREKNDDVA
mmetsp:Transcript_9896/g.20132  ORF Transcript_9896/g.20132 Transcript_9896/m.20132 type:complete len:357 (-) Transcript_9896:79-1149(-)